MRRVLAVAVVALPLLLAGPAHAASPTVEFTTPTDEQRFDVSTFAFSATVRMPGSGSVRGATVSWFSAEGRPVPSTTSHPTTANPLTLQLADRSFPWNGRYRVDVTATGRDGTLDTNGDETSTASADFVVDAPPAPPGTVTTAVTDDRKVRVSWPANAEPDLVGYEVQRQLGSAPWAQVAVTGTGTRNVLDAATAEKGGTYRYRVVAFRASADAGKLNPSQPSSTSTAKVPDPPVTTTTTSSTTAPDDDEEEEGRTGGSRSGTSGSGSSTGGRTGSSGGSTTSTGGSGTTATTLPTSGKVDLSGFASLLEQSRRNGQAPATLASGEDDGGFEETLPFSGRQRPTGDADDTAGNEVAILEEGVSDDGGDDVQSIAFLAGGLLATVLVMHLLWVRSEVHRAGVLEAVAPEAPPRRRRRRVVPEA